MSTLDQAAALWGLDPSQITLAARRENTVHRVQTPDGAFALRFHRPGYRTIEELASELDWMAMLATHGMAVPRPIPSQNGKLVEVIGDTPIDLLTWLPGRMVGNHGALDGISDRTGHMHKLGTLIAELHDHSDAWTPPPGFTRPRWDRAGLVGDTPLWGPFWENPDLSPPQRDLFLAVKDKANNDLAQRETSLDFGLIHADAITENVVIDNERLMLIDFDDGGWGFRDFDLATILMRQLEAPDYPDLRAALCAGYAQRRIVDHTSLDLMILLRALTYPGWIISRRHEPGGEARSHRALSTALPLAERYLNGGPNV